MAQQLFGIFINVVTPVFALVLFGYLAGPRLKLDHQTLSRYAYFILIPAFVFDTMSKASVQAGAVVNMVVFMAIVTLAVTGLAAVVAWALGRSGDRIAAWAVVVSFANVGNFGLPLIQFRLGDEALVPATVYFLAVLVLGFVIGVGVASSRRGTGLVALFSVAKTPALLALPPAILVNVTGWQAPLVIDRIVGLLAVAMVPTMLVTLGVQLANSTRVRIDADVVLASAVRLVAVPLLAVLLAGPLGLAGIERGTGIIQASMPAAVLTAIIAMENKLEPDFVTTTVLFSTLASVLSLTVILALV